MKQLTLLAVDYVYHDLTKFMVDRVASILQPSEVIIVSNKNFAPDYTYIHTKPILNMRDYAHFLLKNLWPLIDTDHCLYMQWDSGIRDHALWTDEFLDCDYIGAPWPWHPEPNNIGNGGLSIRSKKLLYALRDNFTSLSADPNDVAEDVVIGKSRRSYLESNHGIKFPSQELARQFSIEIDAPRPTWGYHGVWNIFSYGDPETIEFFLPRIHYKNWNIYHCLHSLNAIWQSGNIHCLKFVAGQLKLHKQDLMQPIQQNVGPEIREYLV